MKFVVTPLVGLALATSVDSFSLNQKGKIPQKETLGNEFLTTDRRAFVSAALVGGGLGLLSPSQPANAAYFKDGKRVDLFGNPLPVYESLSEKAKEKLNTEDPKFLAAKEAKEKTAKVEQDRIDEENKRLEALEQIPPNVPRVLVLGGTGRVGKEVRSRLEKQGLFVVATSRDGRGNTVELDVTKCFGKIENEIFQIAKENRCSAVVSLIGGVGSENDGQINGATGQAALAASNVPCVRNFVAIGASTSITSTVPKGLESYVKAKQLSQDIVMNTFKSDPKKDGMSYTIINPGAIGKSKNYGSDPSVPLDIVVNAVIVGATGFYINEPSAVLDTIDDIKSKASKISKVKELKV